MTASIRCAKPVCGRPIHWVPRVGEWRHVMTDDARCHQWETDGFRAAPPHGTRIPGGDPTNSGARIRLTASCPWPERVGLTGVIATPPDGYDLYPVAGLGHDQVLVLLDEDPFERPNLTSHDWWTCVLNRRSVEAVTT